jgi:sulfur carrier protein
MNVTVNGAPRDLASGTTLAQVVTELTTAPTGVAVAVNDTVVPRGAWASTVLDDRDRVEILTAVQGG